MALTRPVTIAKQHGITRQSVLNWTTKGRGHGSKREVLPSQTIDGVVFIDSDDVDGFLQRTDSVSKSLAPLLNDIQSYLLDQQPDGVLSELANDLIERISTHLSEETNDE